ncbi:MAG: c-type cytochrome [Mycoplasmataceae bacterium]|nr:c-type cytochrome [Mycoplasmataceae bacterium]
MKSKISLLIHIALALFVIVAIWPALNSSDDGYTGAVAVVPAPAPAPVVEEPAAEPEMIEEAQKEEPVMDAEPVVDAAATPSADPVAAEPQEAASNDGKEDENEAALYSVVDGNKLDAESYAGFKLYRNWCARCHGTYGQGMVGPNLADSLKIIDEKEFFDVVENGKSGTIGSMPAWKKNVKVMAGRDQIYAYLMARSDGAIGVEKPKKQ